MHSIALKSRRALFLLCLWLLFSACCLAAPVCALAFPWAGKGGYLRRLVRAGDKVVAALLGFSGRFTLSAELAHSPRLRWIHAMLNDIQPDHCELEIFDEGIYCKLSDHDWGDK